jgi:hypothetical protein
LQRDNQIPPLLLELNERQTMIRQMSHEYSSPWIVRHSTYNWIVLRSAYKTRANFKDWRSAAIETEEIWGICPRITPRKKVKSLLTA